MKVTPKMFHLNLNGHTIDFIHRLKFRTTSYRVLKTNMSQAKQELTLRACLFVPNRRKFPFFPDKDPCRPNPCSHGGFCSEIGGGFACNCTLGFKGATCLGN